MTIKQCKAASISMPPGTKFRQTYFSPGDFFYRDEKGDLRDETDGYLIEPDFWVCRWDNPAFAEGWEIIKL